MSELTRDYEVNRDIYQDLLKRRENARVSMVLDEEQRGLQFRIQDPAILPLRPSGLRLVHFAMGGIVLALVIPFGLLYALVQFDPRIRSARQLERTTGLVALASIPAFSTAREKVRSRARLLFSAAIVVAVIAAYILVYWSRVMKFS